jgi:hypothetical protein
MKIHSTCSKFTIIKRLWKDAFIAFDNCYVSYKPSEEDCITDMVRRINEGIYAGTLIQRSEDDEEIIVYKTQSIVPSGEDSEKYVEITIKDYFKVEPSMISMCRPDVTVTPVSKINEIFDKAFNAWINKGKHTDYKIIYQGTNIPIKIPGISDIEIYDNDFGMFGVEYEKWVPSVDQMETGIIYHLKGRFSVDSIYQYGCHGKIFELKDGKDDIVHKFILGEKGFTDNKTFNNIGFYSDPLLDVFFSVDKVDVDSTYCTVHLITAESEQYVKDIEAGKTKTEKEISALTGPDKWVVNNSRTGKETECSIKGGENIEYPASATIRFDEGPSFLQVRYRPHRGSLEDSISLAKTFDSPSEMFDHIIKEWGGLIDKEDLSIGKEDWGPDPRIDWPNCHYVVTKRCGETTYDIPQCIGMCCYEGHMLVEDAVVISESAAEDLKMKEEFEFPKIYTGAEKSGYNKNLKMLHDAANYWANKAREERFEKKKED